MLRFASFSLVAITCAALLSSPDAFAQAGTNSDCICSPEQTSKAFTAVAKKSIPAVVFIKVQSNTPEQDEGGYPYGFQNPFDFNGDDFFNRFFGSPYRGGAAAKTCSSAEPRLRLFSERRRLHHDKCPRRQRRR